MTPTSLFRLAAMPVLTALVLSGCTTLLEPDPLNKTTSIVNGTQITRGPARGVVPSGYASAVPVAEGAYEPAIGEPFGIDALDGGFGSDSVLPELQGIDFGAEQASVYGLVSSGEGAGSSLAQIGQTVYFATDSSELDDRARETLRRQAAWLNVNSSARATIEGHADERGTREYNLALGDRRASTTRGYLIAVGVDESRLDKISYGKERPVALGSDPAAWSQNRRTETVIEGADAFASNPVDAAPFDTALTTTTLDPVGLDASPFPSSEPVIAVSDGLTLDPVYSQEGPAAPIATVDYGTTPGVSAPPGEFSTYQGGTIAPTVFDPAPAPVPAPRATGTTRIEDVSVDDLLRDPSLIDRIGTPSATTPGT